MGATKFTRRRLFGTAAVATATTGGALILTACGSAPSAAPTAQPAAKTTASVAQPTSAAAVNAEASTGKSTGQTTKITYWFYVGGPNLKNEKAIVDSYNKSQSEVSVSVDYAADYVPKTLAALAGGKPPDVSYVATGGYQTLSFAKQGGLLALDDYVNSSFKAQVPDFYDFLWQANVWQGKTWGIPYDTNNLAWFYNQELLKADGVSPISGNPTWQQLVAMLKAVTKDGKYGYQVQADARMFYDFLKQAGGELTDKDLTKATLNTPEAEETLTWLRDMVFEWKVSPNPPLKKGFETGAVVFEYQGSYRIPVYRQLTGLKVNAMHTTKNKVPFTANGGESLLIWKTDDAHQEAAWKFIQGMTTKENILQWAIKSGYLPVRKSVLDMDAYKAILKSDPIRQVFVDELAYGGFWLASPYAPDVSTAIVNNLNRVLLKDENIKTVLSDMEKQVNNVLAGKKETG